MVGSLVGLRAEAVLEAHNVRIRGSGAVTALLAHGYGCDGGVWRHIVPALSETYRTVTFDYVGCGASVVAYDPAKYQSLDGYADDVLEICRALGQDPVIFVGHSVSAMIGALAAEREPARFLALVMVAPSPRYLNDKDYAGGFTRQDIESLLGLLDADREGWAAAMAPTIMGNPDRPELADELEENFCRMDPAVARQFARVTFTADNRADLARISVRTLVLQCSDDALAPLEVGSYVYRNLPDGRFVQLAASGHCPHLSAPEEMVSAIQAFLAELAPPERAEDR